MNGLRIVPAIDLIGGRCVRLEQGDFKRVDCVGDDPIAIAQQFAQAGCSRLHLVDLDGARFGEPRHIDILQRIASATQLKIDYSGGLRSDDDLQAAFDAGASQVVIGSAAVISEQLCKGWFQRFGGAKIILGLDLFKGQVRVKGWSEGSELKLLDVISRYNQSGLLTVMSTDISCDGMLMGPSVALYQELRSSFPQLQIIASGGIRSRADLERLAEIGVHEAIVGKALYSGALQLDDLKGFL